MISIKKNMKKKFILSSLTKLRIYVLSLPSSPVTLISTLDPALMFLDVFSKSSWSIFASSSLESVGITTTESLYLDL